MAKINLKQPSPTAQPKPAITFDEPSVREHVSILHGLAAGIEGVLVVSAFHANPHGETDAPGTVTHCRIGDIEGTVDAVMAHAETPHLNVFIGTQVMRPTLGRGQRGKEVDIVAVLALVVDLDADTGLAGTMPVEPSYVLETSPGNYQPFLLLDRPLAPAEAKPLAAALKRASESDHGTGDIAHVWRIPGTANWPNRKKLERGRSADPVAVTIAESWDGTLTEVTALREGLEPWSSSSTTVHAVNIGNLSPAGDVVLTENAGMLLTANDVGDRSEHAARVVEQLAFDGLTAEQACAVFLAADGDWLNRYPTEERATKDFARLWGKFGIPLIEERAEQARVAETLVAAIRRVKAAGGPSSANNAANDNSPLTAMTVPAMDPDPFTPAAAGGLLADIAKWVNATAIVPVPELSLAAAIALLGGCFGKKAIGPTNSGVNIYFATLLATAGGKGHPPKAIRTLGDLCGSIGAVSNGDPTSYASVERMLRKNNSTVMVMDEFGVTLQDVNGKHQNSAAASIRKMLLAIYDQANSVFDGRIYASSETKKDDGPIVGPALTVLAMTTPSTLYQGLSSASVSDGFINRFIFITGTRDEDGIRPPRLDVDLKPPGALVSALQKAITGFPKADGLDAKWKVTFEGGEAGAAYKRWGEVFIWQHHPGWEEVYSDINGRAAENTIRLATIRAISRDALRPMVNLADVEWGWAVVFRSIELIASGVSRHMSASPAEALRKHIVEVLRESPDCTIAYSALLRRKGVRGSDLREVDGALTYLMESGEIKILGKPKPGTGSKFVLVNLATEMAA